MELLVTIASYTEFSALFQLPYSFSGIDAVVAYKCSFLSARKRL